jgi:hypothetical protein
MRPASRANRWTLADARSRRLEVKTQQERRDERRRERAAAMARQVRNGSLVIRQMTDAERRRYPAAKRNATRRT